MAEYKVQFEVFEGPLDLLLYLVKKEEVDIWEVNLTRIATQFVEYLDLMRELDLEVAGEFLVMASTLMYIKSRELLPVDQQAPTEGEEDEEDPRWELIRRLVEYKKFKDAAGRLQICEEDRANTYPRVPGRFEAEAEPAPMKPEVSLFDLINAVSQVLARLQQRAGPREIYEDKWTVSEKIEELRKRVAGQPTFRFSELFEHTTSRSEVVATFLALLELIRLKVLAVVQSAAFGEIDIQRAEPRNEAPPVPPPTPTAPQPTVSPPAVS
jgi:segregation and condensation protein A